MYPSKNANHMLIGFRVCWYFHGRLFGCLTEPQTDVPVTLLLNTEAESQITIC